jgi:ribosomal protein S18 acetylase RimI-like enzyme
MISPSMMDQQAAAIFSSASEKTIQAVATASIAQTQSPWSQVTRAGRVSSDRKLAMLKRSGLFGADLRGATIERACSFDDLRQAYRLVHQVYTKTGFIKPEAAGIRLRLYETTSETATFVAKIDGAVVAVLSVVGDSPDLGLPSDEAFGGELNHLRAHDMRLSELTNQAVADDYRRSALPTELMRCAIAHCLAAGYHEAIATVSPSHVGFYDLIGFRQVGSERSYSSKLHDPVVALSLNLETYRQPAGKLDETEMFLRTQAVEENPYREQVAAWAKQARRSFLNASLLEQLFVAERNFLAECTFEELKILCRRWGQELFALVSGNWFIPPLSSAFQNEFAGHRSDFVGNWLATFNVPGREISARSPRPSRSRSLRRLRRQPQAVR